MIRPSLLVPAVVATLLMAAPAVAPAATSAGNEPALVELRIPSRDGFRISLDIFNDEFDLTFARKGSYASYEVDGEVTETGLKAQFGDLGVIDLSFEPTRTEKERPPKGCVGPPSITSEGDFVGTFRFDGELGFVHLDETRLEGRTEVWRESEWRCPEGRTPKSPRVTHRPEAPASDRRRAPEEASLIASERGCTCYFGAYAVRGRKSRGWSRFVGASFEDHGGMEITRVTYTGTGPSTFTFSHKAGTATARPPAPFSGSVHFERRRHHRELWRSTLEVPLFGAEPLTLSGPTVRAALVPELPESR